MNLPIPLKRITQTGIEFENNTSVYRAINTPISIEISITEGGVALGDINNDGLLDHLFYRKFSQKSIMTHKRKFLNLKISTS